MAETNEKKKLPNNIQVYIIEQFARFRSPVEIIKLVKEQFNEIITKQQLYYYRQLCDKKLKGKPAKTTIELQELFTERREQFKRGIEDIAGFHQPYRMQILQDQLEEEIAKSYPLKRTPIIMDLVEQMAKEVGGMYTNKRELTGANGQPLIPVEEMAKTLFKTLKDQGFQDEDAADFASKRYQIEKEKLIKSE